MSARETQSPTSMTVLGFTLGGRLSGFDISHVQEVLQMVQLTAVPDAPRFVAGALNLRGAVLPVIDLADMLGLERPAYTLETPIIVVYEGERRVGLIVDDVHDVVEFSVEDVDPPGELFPVRRVLSGVARTEDGLMMLFDLVRILELAGDGSGQGGGGVG